MSFIRWVLIIIAFVFVAFLSFAELNDETAESNEWLLGRVQDLEAENAELKEQLKKIEEGWF